MQFTPAEHTNFERIIHPTRPTAYRLDNHIPDIRSINLLLSSERVQTANSLSALNHPHVDDRIHSLRGLINQDVADQTLSTTYSLRGLINQDVLDQTLLESTNYSLSALTNPDIDRLHLSVRELLIQDDQPTNRFWQLINRIHLVMFGNGEPWLLRQIALFGRNNRQRLLQVTEAPFRSIASKLMTIVTTWRNFDGKEWNWVDEGRPFWQGRRAIPLSFYAKAIAAEVCFPVITTIAIVESIVYKIFALLGNNDYELLFQSSSFTILWSLADMALFNVYTNVYTDEALARLKYNFFRHIDSSDLHDTYGSNFVGNDVANINKSTDATIQEGSQFLQNLLRNERAETIESCSEMSVEALKFVLFKTIHHFAIADKSVPIPDFLRPETAVEIAKLREDQSFQTEVADISQYLVMTPEEYDKISQLPPYLEKITKAHGLEFQNKIFLIDCFSAYLESLTKS